MSRLVGCPCGAEQSDVVVPTKNKVHIITDHDLDAATRYGREEDEPDQINADLFEVRSCEGYFCWHCGRLLILENDGRLRIFEELKTSGT